jgi:tetratricopeptide (TPR) repeat protein
MSGGRLDLDFRNTLGEIHRLKSEYLEAHNIRTQILDEGSVDKDPYRRAFSLLDIAEIGVCTGALEVEVQRNIDRARSIFETWEDLRSLQYCDAVEARLNLREGNMLVAKRMFEEGLRKSWDKDADIVSICLENLGNICCWDVSHFTPIWTTVFFAHSLKSKQKLGIHKALQFLGDIFLILGDEDTAISLFTTALDGFTYMDVHCSRAECMLQLGDISRGRNDLFKAVELWEAARPLFEQSSQVNQIEQVNKRVASISADGLEQHRSNLTLLQS